MPKRRKGDPGTVSKALDHESAIYENILVNMADGVITINLEGRIITFNPAAGRILGLDPKSVIGRTYAELFFEDPGNDDLNELVLKAIYESQTTHSQEIELRRQGHLYNLSVSTTFLHADSGTEVKRLGVIVVISDVTEQRKRKKVERLFGQYVDPRIVERILDHGGLETAGVRQSMTISFCDLEGFTRLSEPLAAEDLIRFVNAYLAVMSEPVGAHNGVTDKYIGDAIMAFWGPPFTTTGDPAIEACHTALEQRALLGELRRRVGQDLRLPVEVERIDLRCGIATGEVVAGSIGPERSRNYTVIGDRVNVASRLESANKALGSRVLVCEQTWTRAAAAFEFREIDTIEIRGRRQPERVFELLALKGELAAEQSRLREAFAAGLAAYRACRFPAARQAIEAGLAAVPGDRPSRTLLERIAVLESAPPSDGWDGVWRGPGSMTG